MAVRKLEADVGARLLHRTTRSVQLTEDELVFHARARDLLADVDDSGCTQCSHAIEWHFAGAYGSICRAGNERGTDHRAGLAGLSARLILSWSLEVSSTDRQVDLVQEGFDCVLRLGPIGDDTDCLGPLQVTHGQRRQSCLLGALWRPSIARRSAASETSGYPFRATLGANPMDGSIRTATATRGFSCQVRCTSTACRPTKPLVSPALA